MKKQKIIPNTHLSKHERILTVISLGSLEKELKAELKLDRDGYKHITAEERDIKKFMLKEINSLANKMVKIKNA